MEVTKIDEAEGLDTPVDPDERDNPRLIGEVVAEIVTGLGSDQAIMPGNLVRITPAAGLDGSGGAQVATQSIRLCKITKRHPVDKTVRTLPMGAVRLTGRGSVGGLLPIGPYASLGAGNGGDAPGAVLFHRNLVAPRHRQAAFGVSGDAFTLSARSTKDTSLPLSLATS